MNKQRFLVFVITLSISFTQSFGDEGMWIPKLIKEQESKMKSLGMAISAEEIYSESNNSLKDAIIHFGGGCTGSIISNQGLIITNHHCGYSQIQSHSSLENNYLKDGFWAENPEDELPNRGLTATRIISMNEVTKEVLYGITSKMSDEEKAELIEKNIKSIGESAIAGTHYDYQIRPYYEGNQFYLILREVFRDVRLVGAPPSLIGKFGFDTDNWVWPRHTGDFSIFRIYTDKDNLPADYSINNVPYTPLRSLELSLNGIKENDFTMVYGFPGTTDEYMYSKHLSLVVDKVLPLSIEMRTQSLNIIDKAMRANEETAIQYASKQSRISNGYKKWIGQRGGLKRIDAVGKKQALEAKFNNAISKDKKFKKAYGEIFTDFDKELAVFESYYLANTLWREYVYYGPEFIRFVNGIERDLQKSDDLESTRQTLRNRSDNFFKNYNAQVDADILNAQSKIFFNKMNSDILNAYLIEIKEKFKQDYKGLSEYIFSNSAFTDKVRIDKWINEYQGEPSSLYSDPAIQLMTALYAINENNIANPFAASLSRIMALEKVYIEAQMKVLPEEKEYYPNANGTLRISYGNVKGYEPVDAVKYSYATSGTGIIQKHIPGSYEFEVPEKLLRLIENKDFGVYADGSELPICFIATNHTSGGNSGSPAFNGKGQLIGLNFDRTWESTMSDMMYDPSVCRNIMVDIRYVLFIIDKFADAQRLIEEIKMVD